MSRSLRRILPCALLLVFIAGSASAALSPKYDAWRNGPVQWIMTSEEQRAWRALKTDEEASTFIDLFWARRDPSPGTPTNDYRDQFYGRVGFADAKFGEGKIAGSMTDRGRVYIVLGKPTEWSVQVRNSNSAEAGTEGMTEGGTRLRATKDTWLWEREDAQRHGRPRIEVVFIQKVGTERMLRDPSRPDFMSAAPAAIANSIVNKDLTSVPEWAIFGGLDPKFKPAPAAAGGDRVATVTVPFDAAAPAPVANDRLTPVPSGLSTVQGASRFTLLQNVYDIDTETRNDPFTSMKTAEVFTSSDELGWATQYCAPEEEPLVRFALLLTGTAENEVIERAAPPDEMVPDRIRSSPGCFMLRGAIPLEGMSAGAYELELSILDAKDNTVQALKRSFRIE